MATDQAQTFGKLVSRYRRECELTQEKLAEKLNLSVNHISSIERGQRRLSRPHLKKLAKELGLHQPGREQDYEHFMRAADQLSISLPTKQDLGEAPHPVPFYGRKMELDNLKQMILDSHGRCSIVSIVGMGGTGKSSLAAKVTEQLDGKFAYIFWRTLKNALPLQNFLHACLRFLSNQQRIELPENVSDQITFFIQYLRDSRCLIILDNIEGILQGGGSIGQYREGYEGYGDLLQRVGEVHHQSCLLLTSQEQLKEVTYLQDKTARVRTLKLDGVGLAEGKEILKDKGLSGEPAVLERLIHFYEGNPVALQLVARYIQDVFSGDIAAFFEAGDAVFGDIFNLLEQQFLRLSPPEQDIMYWLAIEREAISLKDLSDNLVQMKPRGEIHKAVAALRQRSMIEAKGPTSYTLLPVIMEYVTHKLIEQIYEEIDTEKITMFASHAFVTVYNTKEYIRDSQIRLILTPVKERLLAKYGQREIEQRLKNMLTSLRTKEQHEQGYTAGNMLNFLIRGLNSDLRGYDFSRLKIRQAYLQNAYLQEVNFSQAVFEQSVFTDVFGSILSVAFSTPHGEDLAAGTANGEIRLWRTDGGVPKLTYEGHTQWVFGLAFSTDGETVASGSGDHTVRVWNAKTGECLHILAGHTAWVRSVAFSHDGKQLVSCSEDKTICLWDVKTGACLHTFNGHTAWVTSVAFSPDNQSIASGSKDATIRLWDVTTGDCLHTLVGHEKGVWSVAFNHDPDGNMLASGSEDQTICLWDVKKREKMFTLTDHLGAVRGVAFSPDNKTVASCSEDTTVRLWDVSKRECFNLLQGHTSWTRSVAFSPDGSILASGSEDQTVCLWDAQTGDCLKVLQGHTNRIRSIAFNPEGNKLVSCSEDKTVFLWDIDSGECIPVHREHTSRVRTLAFNPNGSIVASGSDDQTICLWDTSAGRRVKILSGHTNSVRSVAYRPDGAAIASGSDDGTVRLWDPSKGKPFHVLKGHESRVRAVAFSPDGDLVASGSEDRTVRLWDARTGECLHTLQGHINRIWAVAFSPDGDLVASGSEDRTVRLWDARTGECLHTLQGHEKLVWAVAFSPQKGIIASGSEDGTICIWQVDNGNLLLTLKQADAAQKVRSVAFSPDGRKLASASNDGIIKLWDLEEALHSFGEKQELTKAWKTFKKSGGPYDRMNIRDVSGLTDEQKDNLRTLGAIEE